MSELLIRALIGGIVVSAFAVIGDLLKPKRFTGLLIWLLCEQARVLRTWRKAAARRTPPSKNALTTSRRATREDSLWN